MWIDGSDGGMFPQFGTPAPLARRKKAGRGRTVGVPKRARLIEIYTCKLQELNSSAGRTAAARSSSARDDGVVPASQPASSEQSAR